MNDAPGSPSDPRDALAHGQLPGTRPAAQQFIYNAPITNTGAAYYGSTHIDQQYGGTRNVFSGPVFFGAGNPLAPQCHNPVPYPAPPAKPRAFISHYADAGVAAATLAQVVTKLTPTFDLLCDNDRLNGAGWRNSLYTWLDVAHVGVIVFSPTVLQSPAADIIGIEAATLVARQAADREFMLIPLLVDVSIEQLEQAPAFALLNLKGLPVPPTSDLSVLNRLVQRAQAYPFPEPPVDKLIHSLYNLISCLTDAALVNAAVKLRLDLRTVTPQADPRIALMRHLWHADLACLLAALEELRYELNGAPLQTLIDATAAACIDPRAAALVAVAAARPRKQRALQVKSQRPPFVGTMLVRRAYCLSPQQRANIVYVQNVNDGSSLALITEIRTALRGTLYPGEAVDDATLDADLAGLGDPPVFVVVPVAALDDALVDELLKNLPDVTFVFVLLSSAASTAPLRSQAGPVLMLDAEPDHDAVNQAFSGFRNLFNRLQLTRPTWSNPS